jgi:Periplasmic binding protein
VQRKRYQARRNFAAWRSLLSAPSLLALPGDNFCCAAPSSAPPELSPQSYTGIALEGWLNAVVVTEALRRTGPDPSRQDFIRAMEPLHGFDPGLGVKLEFSSTSHQGLHKVWLSQTANGRWLPVQVP